jgi:hypothetical protein
MNLSQFYSEANYSKFVASAMHTGKALTFTAVDKTVRQTYTYFCYKRNMDISLTWVARYLKKNNCIGNISKHCGACA